MVGSPAMLRGVSTSQADVDPRRYRDVLGRFVTGVTVITSAVETPPGIHPRRSPFSGASYALSASGLPILDAAVAHLECTVEKTLDAGDHTIYLARVIGLGLSEGHPPPLLSYRARPLGIG